MPKKITVWATYDNYSGSWSLVDFEASGYTPIEMTQRQFDAIRDASKRFQNATEFVMRAMGLKHQWLSGTETDPEVDDTLLPP